MNDPIDPIDPIEAELQEILDPKHVIDTGEEP